MAEGRNGEGTEDGAARAGRPDASVPRYDHGALPAVESPPLSPAEPDPALALDRKLEPKPEVIAAGRVDAIECAAHAESGESKATAVRSRWPITLTRLSSHLRPLLPRFRLLSLPHIQLTPRRRRRLVLASTVVLAATFGAAVGSQIDRDKFAPASDKVAQAAIAQLSREVDVLKAKLAAMEAVEKQVAAVEAAKPAPRSDVTGSVPPVVVPAPIPPPRPAEQIATAVSRPPVVRGWTLRVARDGLFLVEGRGEIYQVVPDAPLPGLGPVQAIKRQDGRWTVVTPKGLIVSRRDRRHFE
jgi:hypothetical protein